MIGDFILPHIPGSLHLGKVKIVSPKSEFRKDVNLYRGKMARSDYSIRRILVVMATWFRVL